MIWERAAGKSWQRAIWCQHVYVIWVQMSSVTETRLSLNFLVKNMFELYAVSMIRKPNIHHQCLLLLSHSCLPCVIEIWYNMHYILTDPKVSSMKNSFPNTKRFYAGWQEKKTTNIPSFDNHEPWQWPAWKICTPKEIIVTLIS